MLKRLQVRDFKSLRELDVEFGRLTVLVGANGCGKSSVLQAIKLVCDLALAEPRPRGERPPFPVGTISQLSGSSEDPRWIRMRTDHANGLVTHANLNASDAEPNYLAVTSSLMCKLDDLEFTHPWTYHNALDKKPLPSWVGDAWRGVELFQLDKRIMERPTYSEEAEPVLGTRGENLATVLDALQGSRREQFEAIEGQLSQLVPSLRRIRLRRTKMPFTRTVIVGNEYRQVTDGVVGHQVMLDFEFARNVAADQASEGTILLLGLLTVIGAETSGPMTIMLDDLDRALHPKAQRQLVEHLHTLLDQRPELQIIATSHSPYLVEHLAYDEVLAMTQSPIDGRSLIAPLASHPDADRWRDEMSAGEFWSSVGEDWIHQAKAQ